jgi:hypothetical protein
MSLLIVVTVGLGAITWVTEAAFAESRQEVAAAVADGDDPVSGDKKAGASRSDRRDGLDAATPEPVPASTAVAAPRRPTAEATPRAEGSARKRPRARTTRKEPQAEQRPSPPRAGERIIRLPADVQPSVWKAAEDEELLRRNGCLEGEDATESRDCEFSAGRGRFIVALVGDSHASHWYPALRKVAQDRGWRLVTSVKVSCPFTDIPVKSLRLKRVYRECETFNESSVARLKRLKPDLVITAMSRWQHPVRPEDETAWAQGAAVARMLGRVPGHKVVIADVPYPGQDVPTCLSDNIKDIRECAVPTHGRVSGGSPQRERVAARLSDGTLIDFGDVLCGGPGSCPVVRHDRIIFRDDHHLTATFSRWLAPDMDRTLAKVIRKAR